MSLTEQISNKLTRKQKIFLILSIGAMWIASTTFDVYLRADLEKRRIEMRNESDRLSAEVLKELLENITKQKRLEDEAEADSKDWSI